MSVQQELRDQYAVARARREDGGGEKSYTSYLYAAGLDKILKKCGEETFEAVIAAKEDDEGELVGELNDVLYHVTVLLCLQNVPFDAVLDALNTRCQTQGQTVDALFSVIEMRARSDDPDSYTAYLFREGLDKILKKVGEACSLLLIAAKNENGTEVAAQTANLMYHLMAMMVCRGTAPAALEAELVRRSRKTGNLKTFHTTNQNT